MLNDTKMLIPMNPKPSCRFVIIGAECNRIPLYIANDFGIISCLINRDYIIRENAAGSAVVHFLEDL